MKRLVDVTQKQPLKNETNHWNGEIQNVDDWQSLIEYWYQVRCKIVHGVGLDAVYTWLAYETLDIFMQEIIRRARDCIKSSTSKNCEMQHLSLSSTRPILKN